ncbi:MAG TPA: DNA-protecting protein DprA [Candidatus Paceibacterota bacterium]|nr:DNA-protecting protein DprA [Candidatus Paceibacterota bacterium]
MQDGLRQLGLAEYPSGLAEIPEPPEQLHVRGALPPKGTKYLTVVGSRALTAYGRQACHKLIGGLAGYPVAIVSGLALGADAEAHRAALGAGLHAVAFPGSGIADDAIAPRTNYGLAKEILEKGGALVSEYEPDTRPAPWMFPERNRLMVGIADAVLMIEAGERSGTLITARLAGEYNRELLAVPHRIGDVHGFGSHLFLRLGATLVTEPAHILEALRIPIERPNGMQDVPTLEGSERKLYEMLEEPRPRDELIRDSKLPAGEALTALVTLELKGLAKEEFGSWRRL